MHQTQEKIERKREIWKKKPDYWKCIIYKNINYQRFSIWWVKDKQNESLKTASNEK